MPFSATTQGIHVEVVSEYLKAHSDPTTDRYVFSYTITIRNSGEAAARLQNRHWKIMHGSGEQEEVKGPGVVGKHPHLEPGQEFSYSSGCVLKTPHGTMHGSYEMVRDDGTTFDAEIPAFSLSVPLVLN